MLINGESLANESEQLPPNTQEPPQVFSKQLKNDNLSSRYIYMTIKPHF